ncbi:MAG: DUF47 family protein [Desulfobacterales bacterium]
MNAIHPLSETFEELRQEVSRFENEADAIKRRILGHLPKGVMMPIEKFQLFRYLRSRTMFSIRSKRPSTGFLSGRMPEFPNTRKRIYFF